LTWQARHYPLPFLAFLLALVVVVAVLAAGLGAVEIRAQDIAAMLLNRVPGLHLEATWSEAAETILFEARLPRVAAGMLVGAALAAAGVVFQGLLRNPMADPYIIGTAAGAALGAALVFLTPIAVTAFGFVPLFAFFGAHAAILIVYRIARTGNRAPITTLLLAGFAVSSFLTALMSFLIVVGPPALQRAMISWTMGGLSVSGWERVAGPGALIAATLLVTYVFARDMNVLLLGEEQATYLGLDVERRKMILLGLGSLLTASAVSIGGLVGFVGLVVPHVARLLVGPDHRTLLPASALAGAGFLMLADLVARTALAPNEIPVGLVTALVGAPFFAYLLRRTKREYTF